MPKHDVTVELPTETVLRTDVKFVVRSDDERLGELQVSKGSVDWIPANARTRYHMEWEKFHEMMVEHATREPY